MFIICLDNVLRTSIDLENAFTLKRKARSIRYPIETITDADYVDELSLLANIPAKDESLLHSLEQAAGNIGLYVNVKKIEFI